MQLHLEPIIVDNLKVGDLLFCDDPEREGIWYYAILDKIENNRKEFHCTLVDTNHETLKTGYKFYMGRTDIIFYEKVNVTIPYCEIWRETNA